jgi:Cu(I)/Ag(I) efflux system membrane protein CusA/SilA
LFGWGIYSVQQNPIDAIPDLSENQVIVFTEWMGRSPQVIEDQVTYPLVSNLQGIPKSKHASSMFGMSFVYIILKTCRSLLGANSCFRTIELCTAIID